MYSDRTKTRVGTVTLLGVGAALIVVLGFGGVELRPSIRIHVEFEHVGALKQGADVQIAGRVVGRVTGISLHSEGATAHVLLEERYVGWAPRNAEVFVASKGLLSQKYLEIGPPPNGQAPGPPVEANDRLRGIAPVRVEMVVLRSIENTRRFRELLTDLAPPARLFAKRLDELSETVAELDGPANQLQRLASSARRLLTSIETSRSLLNDVGLFDGRIARLQERIALVSAQLSLELSAVRADLDLLAADLERIGRLESSEALLKLSLAASRAEALLADFQETTAIATEVFARIRRGEGTVGGLLHDPEFIDEAKQLGRIIKRQPWKLIGTSRKPSKQQ